MVEEKKKVKLDVKVDVYENGIGVSVRHKKRGRIASRVFEGTPEEYNSKYKEWINKIIESENEK